MSELKRIGHKGADLIEPGNTPASFDAALEHGVDMIEFDVLPERRSGRLILAHDYKDAARSDVLSLEEGVRHLATVPFAQIELDVDLKLPGYELQLLNVLDSYGLTERSLISTQYPESLACIRSARPKVRLGWSVPRAKRDFTKSPIYKLPALAALAYLRLAFPDRAARAINDGRCDAIMAHWRLVNRKLVEAVHGAGGEVYVWTIDDGKMIRKLDELGVDGVITNDPRLFKVASRDS